MTESSAAQSSTSEPATPGAAGSGTQSAIAKERRASRKAAAACLARQRHKHFVNSLQDQGGGLRERVVQMRARRGKMGAICAEHMMTLMEEKLLPERYQQLRTWLEGSVILDPPPLPTLDAVADARDAEAVKAAMDSMPIEAMTPLVEKPRATARAAAAAAAAAANGTSTSEKDDDKNSTPKSQSCLDEELSKQLFMEQAVSAVGTALYLADDDDDYCDDDDEMEVRRARSGAIGDGGV